MRAIAVLSVLGVFLLSACTAEESGVSIGANPSGGGETTLIKLQVEGMACGVMCPPKIRDDLMTVKGVEEVKVEAHLDPEHLLEGIRRFAADRDERLRLLGHPG